MVYTLHLSFLSDFLKLVCYAQVFPCIILFPAIQTTAWVGTVLLVILTAVYIILLCTYCYHLRHKPEIMGYEQHNSDSLTIGDQEDEHEKAVPV